MMDNRKLYKRSFDKLYPGEKLQKELENMMNETKYSRPRRLRTLATLAAAVVLVLSLAVAASATGLFDSVRLWINGQEVDAAAYTKDDGSIEVVVEDGDGYVEILTGNFEEISGDAAMYRNKVDAQYLWENGRDLIRFTNLETGEVYDLDVTDRLVDGVYKAELEVFGCSAQVDLTTDGDSISFSFTLSEE